MNASNIASRVILSAGIIILGVSAFFLYSHFSLPVEAGSAPRTENPHSDADLSVSEIEGNAEACSATCAVAHQDTLGNAISNGIIGSIITFAGVFIMLTDKRKQANNIKS